MSTVKVQVCDLCGYELRPQTKPPFRHWTDSIGRAVLSFKDVAGSQRVPFEGDCCMACARELEPIISAAVKAISDRRLEGEAKGACMSDQAAFDSLSDYDKAIHALAPYLPDGWVAFRSEDMEFNYFEREPFLQEQEASWRPHWRSGNPQELFDEWIFKVPKIDWRESLRRITHNSDGTVTVGRG